MDYTEALAYLDRHIALGIKPGLDRIEGLLEDMGRPHDGYPVIHIAGTNGKTSTSRLATLLLVAHGLSTGTYISPHLQKVEERLSINGRVASREEFALAVSDVAAFAEVRESAGAEANTYFELTTAAAFALFADQAVNVAVLEVGLGGRLDATNVVDAEVCVLTSIGIEHTEYLGEDVATIAGEKLAIAGPNSILVSGPLPDVAREVAEARARDLGIHHRHYGRDFSVLDAERGVGGWLATIGGAEDTYEDLFLPLHGRYQLVNLANAVAATEALIGRKLDEEAVRAAVATATVPGRMEVVGAKPLIMLDGAHNADGVSVLAESLVEEYPTIRWHLVLGVMGDKNVEAMMTDLAPMVRGVITTAPKSERSVPPGLLAERISDLVDTPVLVADDVELALDMARAEAGPDGAVLVAGSLYLVGEARELLVRGG
jgi:dihydrofolate synthase/folylpolyglutamate synthase